MALGLLAHRFTLGGGNNSVPIRHRYRHAEVPGRGISDAAVLSAIRADLDRSPWIGEGHRKIWARLRVLDGIRVARKRVLRLMRENGLLSPHRHLARQGEAHDGRIITTAPNLMWGTDATQIPTVLAVCRRRPLERGSYGVARCQDW